MPLLLLIVLITIIACGKNDHMESEQQIQAPASIQSAYLPDVRYKAEDFSLLPYNKYRPYSIGSVQIIDNLVFIPRIVERIRWSDNILQDSDEWHFYSPFEIGVIASAIQIADPNGNGMLVVGRDIKYGEDFFCAPYFEVTVRNIEDIEDDSGDIYCLYSFDPDVIHVNILDVDIVTLYDTKKIRLLANLLYENGDISTIYAQFSNFGIESSETVIEQRLIGSADTLVWDAWFDVDGSILLSTFDLKLQTRELVVIDKSATRRLAQLYVSFDFELAIGIDGEVWGIGRDALQLSSGLILRSLNKTNWTWSDGVNIPVNYIIGLHAAPEYYEFEWFVSTEAGLYGINKSGEVVRYITWHDIDVRVTQDTELLFLDYGKILILTTNTHPTMEGAVMLESTLLSRTDAIDEREILIIGGVNIGDSAIYEYIRQFNRESKTHRAVIYDYAETGDWHGVAMRLRTDLITGRGPDVIIFNQWGDENDITTAMMRGGFLANLNAFLDNDPVLSREDFFENILDIWTNSKGELSLITGAVIPTPFWGPSDKLNNFTDFTHKGFLEFLRNAQIQGVAYPAGLNFLPQIVFYTMLFADNTFFCYESGVANFDSDLFIDILSYAANIPDEQQSRWIDAMQTGEATNQIPFILRGEQLMTNMQDFMDVYFFRIYDAAVGGLTPIGAPNAAGDLAIPTRPIRRMGIRANSQNQEAAWEFIRIYLQQPNIEGSIEGIPILRNLFEESINDPIFGNEPFVGGAWLTGGIEIEVPALTEERAAVLRLIMESITHEYHPDPHIMAIILEDTAPFFAGTRSAEDTARIIQSRVSRYLAELS